jgi:hypothetical protein
VAAAAEQEPPSQDGTGAHDSQLFDVSTGEGQTRRSCRNRRHLGRRRIVLEAGGCDPLGTPTGGRRHHTTRLGHRTSRCTTRGSGRAGQHRQRCNCQARTHDQSSCPHDDLPLLPAGFDPGDSPSSVRATIVTCALVPTILTSQNAQTQSSTTRNVSIATISVFNHAEGDNKRLTSHQCVRRNRKLGPAAGPKWSIVLDGSPNSDWISLAVQHAQAVRPSGRQALNPQALRPE